MTMAELETGDQIQTGMKITFDMYFFICILRYFIMLNNFDHIFKVNIKYYQQINSKLSCHKSSPFFLNNNYEVYFNFLFLLIFLL